MTGIYQFRDHDKLHTLQLIQHEEGRIIPLDESHPAFISGSKEHDYQYHLKDHLGNVRVTFSTTPEAFDMVASMELSDEQDMFSNYLPTPDGAVAHSGTHVYRNSNTSNGGLGMSAFLGLNKGDTIKVSAHAYNSDAGGTYNLAAGLIESALFGTFNANHGIEGAAVSQANFDNAFGTGTALGDRPNSSDRPPAYLNYLFFDKDMNYVTAGFAQIESASNGMMAPVSTPDFIADREGYIMVYLSNETQGMELIVSWDDFTIYHGKTNIVSTQDYYPFGLEFNSYSRTASEPQNFKYNGKEKIEELNWYDYGARMYNPEIGRWHNLDPLADKYISLSPFAYVANNPLSFIDPDGKRIVNPLKMVLSNKRFIRRLRKFDRALAQVAGVKRSSYELIITGGDRYKDADGKILSRTNNKEISNSNPDLFHLQENGALGVDIRESQFTDKQLKKAAKKAGLQYQAGYDDGHFLLEHDSQEAKDAYLNDATVDKNFVPTDDDLNKESEKIESLTNSISSINGSLKSLGKKLAKRKGQGKDVGNLEVRIQFYNLLKEAKQNKLDRLNSED